VIGTWGKTASWVAQTTAASDSADPSTPTTVPYFIVVFHISRSLPRALYLHPEGLDEQPIRSPVAYPASTKLPALLGNAGGVGLEHHRLRRHPTPSRLLISQMLTIDDQHRAICVVQHGIAHWSHKLFHMRIVARANHDQLHRSAVLSQVIQKAAV